MSSEEFAIRVRGVSKCYQIYDKPHDRLKQAIIPRLMRWLGRLRDKEATREAPRFFREFWALKDISFDVPRGGTVGIIGRNGSGKSTLLQIICGTLTPTAGDVEVSGRVAALLELGAGFNPDFSGRENVYMNASILGLSRQEIDLRFNAIEAFADIGDFIEQPVKTYSSGMIVRLAFAVIAHVDADILVIDEALAVGDAFFTQKCMRFLRHFMSTGTILFVSHDTGAVVGLCESAIWLEGGQKRLEDSAKVVADSYLEALVIDRQGEGKADRQRQATPRSSPPVSATRHDQRLSLLNASPYRNDLEVFSFNPAAGGFGLGSGRIRNVAMLDQEGRPLSWVVGGETITLLIEAETEEPLESPIVGFLIRDRLGQMLFGDNTYLTYHDEPVAITAGQRLSARFTFSMPILPIGDYSITVALADGTQQEHVQQHWIHDALVFRSHSSSVSHGLVGIPMHEILLETDTVAPESSSV
jgi:lipopolysaccharide transport system ATP-binding protein